MAMIERNTETSRNRRKMENREALTFVRPNSIQLSLFTFQIYVIIDSS